MDEDELDESKIGLEEELPLDDDLELPLGMKLDYEDEDPDSKYT